MLTWEHRQKMYGQVYRASSLRSSSTPEPFSLDPITSRSANEFQKLLFQIWHESQFQYCRRGGERGKRESSQPTRWDFRSSDAPPLHHILIFISPTFQVIGGQGCFPNPSSLLCVSSINTNAISSDAIWNWRHPLATQYRLSFLLSPSLAYIMNPSVLAWSHNYECNAILTLHKI